MSEPVGMLESEELDDMAEEAAKYLPARVTILRNQGGDNEQGGETKDMQAVAVNVPARLAPGASTAILRNAADRMSVEFPWTITLPAYTDTEPEDEIVWNTRRFTVIMVAERDYEVTRRLLTDEIQD